MTIYFARLEHVAFLFDHLRSTSHVNVSVALPLQIFVQIPPFGIALGRAAGAAPRVDDSLRLANVGSDTNYPPVAKLKSHIRNRLG